MSERRSDCEVLTQGIENVFNGIGDCFDTAFDEKKSKMNVVGSVFGLGKSMLGLTYNAGKCAIKNTPKAIVAVADAKREVVASIEESFQEQQKQKQVDALNEKIKNLTTTQNLH